MARNPIDNNALIRGTLEWGQVWVNCAKSSWTWTKTNTAQVLVWRLVMVI